MKILNKQSCRVGCHSNVLVVGHVVIVKSQIDLKKLNKGDILIAKQTDVNYTPYMLGASAVITEDGGRYSHAATFSRENNIPCLIGMGGIMEELHDGELISIDTKNKTITIISEKEGD